MMEEVEIVTVKDVSLKNPILIEGLPGVGHVGKLVAEHMIDELDAEKIIDIYSSHFPPQVLVMEDGTVRLVQNEIYSWSSKDVDVLILVGDYQSATNVGHYLLTEKFLEIAKKYGVSRIYTLGGYGIGQLVEDQSVLGAVNNIELIDEIRSYGVEFKENEPGGGIVGVSGLLLGMAKRIGIDAICLMGLTSGYLVDPKSAQAVLKVLSNALDFEIDMQALAERAKEMERIVAKIREMEAMQMPKDMLAKEDLGYIR
ncbi:MAG: proteasome assembly chaperone family protein [Halobacteriota archaeon]|nr:proteasome assembly chaperone family protein [Halobacteriota archaeon]